MEKEYIREFSGKILGYIQTRPNGDKTAHLFSGKIVGKYNKAMNWTTTFEGRVLAKGDILTSLIYAEARK